MTFEPLFSQELLPSLLDSHRTLADNMAKSVRASVSKRNRANLRKKVFGPVVDARTERLAAKLQEIASQPKPEATKKAERETDTDENGMWAATCLWESIVLTSLSQPNNNVMTRRPLWPVRVG